MCTCVCVSVCVCAWVKVPAYLQPLGLFVPDKLGAHAKATSKPEN